MYVNANPEGLSSCILAWTPSAWEIVLVVVAILLLFGGRKLPELARGLGKGLRLFKKELKGVKDDLEETSEADEKPTGGEGDKDSGRE